MATGGGSRSSGNSFRVSSVVAHVIGNNNTVPASSAVSVSMSNPPPQPIVNLTVPVVSLCVYVKPISPAHSEFTSVRDVLFTFCRFVSIPTS